MYYVTYVVCIPYCILKLKNPESHHAKSFHLGLVNLYTFEGEVNMYL